MKHSHPPLLPKFQFPQPEHLDTVEYHKARIAPISQRKDGVTGFVLRLPVALIQDWGFFGKRKTSWFSEERSLYLIAPDNPRAMAWVPPWRGARDYFRWGTRRIYQDRNSVVFYFSWWQLCSKEPLPHNPPLMVESALLWIPSGVLSVEDTRLRVVQIPKFTIKPDGYLLFPSASRQKAGPGRRVGAAPAGK